nr:hypothetical protein [Tanacetum cinerariifolium]
EEDVGLRCSSSTTFATRFKRKVIKSNMIGLRKKVKASVIHDDGANRKRKKTLFNGGNKEKENVFEDEDADRKTKKTLVNGGAVKTGRYTGVFIGDGGFNNVGGKEEVVNKRGV